VLPFFILISVTEIKMAR